MTDPICTEGMRHAAEEDDNTGNHLQANYLRAGADEIDRLRAELASVNEMNDTLPEINRGLVAATKRIAELEDAIDEAVEFIRNRHNYGPRVREAMRLAILKRHSGMKEATEARSAAKAALDGEKS